MASYLQEEGWRVQVGQCRCRGLQDRSCRARAYALQQHDDRCCRDSYCHRKPEKSFVLVHAVSFREYPTTAKIRTAAELSLKVVRYASNN